MEVLPGPLPDGRRSGGDEGLGSRLGSRLLVTLHPELFAGLSKKSARQIESAFRAASEERGVDNSLGPTKKLKKLSYSILLLLDKTIPHRTTKPTKLTNGLQNSFRRQPATQRHQPHSYQCQSEKDSLLKFRNSESKTSLLNEKKN